MKPSLKRWRGKGWELEQPHASLATTRQGEDTVVEAWESHAVSVPHKPVGTTTDKEETRSNHKECGMRGWVHKLPPPTGLLTFGTPVMSLSRVGQ
eukprot:2031552-Pyramimonas_sp.AAC.2